ncbi:MAG TPA: tetratricopeptide repeat protein [Terriglobia bacterium]|nr:tetratricopeptide repeat protein [Terriglobia bacterium]
MTHVGMGLRTLRRSWIIPVIGAVSLQFLILPGLPVVGASLAQDRYEQLVEQGKQAEAAGKGDEAIARYQEALKIKAGSPLLQTRLATIYFNRKDFEKTLDYCDRVLAANPRDPAAAKLAGMAAYQMNRFEQAAKYLRTALATRSNDAQLHYWLGMTLYALSDARQALDEFYRARLYNPKDIEVLYMIGRIHWQMSTQAWEEMVKVDPDSVRVKQMVAEQDEVRNLYAEAIAKYKEIIQQQPEMPGVHYELGKLCLHIEKFAEAEEAFQGELKLNPHSPLAYYGLAEVAFQRQDLPVALENANRAIKENPDYGDAYVLLGRIESNMGDKQKAVEVLERATVLSPSDPSPFYMLGHLYTDLGKSELAAKAVATYQQLQDEQEKEKRVAR